MRTDRSANIPRLFFTGAGLAMPCDQMMARTGEFARSREGSPTSDGSLGSTLGFDTKAAEMSPRRCSLSFMVCRRIHAGVLGARGYRNRVGSSVLQPPIGRKSDPDCRASATHPWAGRGR